MKKIIGAGVFGVVIGLVFGVIILAFLGEHTEPTTKKLCVIWEECVE